MQHRWRCECMSKKRRFEKRKYKKKVEVVVYFQLWQMSENKRADVNLPLAATESLFSRADFVQKQYMGQRWRWGNAKGKKKGWSLTCGVCACSLKQPPAPAGPRLTIQTPPPGCRDWCSLVSTHDGFETWLFTPDLLLPETDRKKKKVPTWWRSHRWAGTVPVDVNPGGHI